MFEFFEFFNSVSTWVKSIWMLAVSYGIFGVGFLISLGFAYFSPVMKKTALWVALAFLTHGVAFNLGDYFGKYKIQVQWDAANAKLDRSVDRAVRDADKSAIPDGVRNDPFNSKDN